MGFCELAFMQLDSSYLYSFQTKFFLLLFLRICQQLLNSHLLRQSKHCNICTAVTFPTFHPVSQSRSFSAFYRPAQTAKILPAKIIVSIWHKRKYGGIFWEKTARKMALRFTTTARTEFNFWQKQSRGIIVYGTSAEIPLFEHKG